MQLPFDWRAGDLHSPKKRCQFLIGICLLHRFVDDEVKGQQSIRLRNRLG
jgi:hypothetical protein